MEIPSRPKWLPTEGPGNMNVSPEKWAMTLRQWVAFIATCMTNVDTWSELEGADGKDEGVGVNLYQVNETFVKPWTRNLGNSIALLLNGRNQLNAELVVALAWGEDLTEAVVAVLCKASAMGMALETPIWFCPFAQYQPGDEEGDCGPGLAAQLGMDPVQKVISSNPSFGVMMVHTSTVGGRLWSTYEVNAWQDAGIVPFAVMSLGYVLEACDGREKGKKLAEICGSMSAEAKLWSPEEERMINAQIAVGICHEELDNKVLESRTECLQRMLEMRGPLLEWYRPQAELTEETPHECMKTIYQKIQNAGLFIALHCLLMEAEDYEDDDFTALVVSVAKTLLEPMMLGDDDEGPMPTPPGFDPAKRESDSYLVDLAINDVRLKAHLQDLEKFQHPVAFIEMAEGGNVSAA